MTQSHKLFRAILAGEAKQKEMTIFNGGESHLILLTLTAPEVQPESSQPNSSAEPAGWNVHITYKSSPESVIFNGAYISESEAEKVFDDLVMAAAEVEGLVKSEKNEEAATATQTFLNKCGANSGQIPAEVKK